MAVQVAEREATIHQYADEVRATKRYNGKELIRF